MKSVHYAFGTIFFLAVCFQLYFPFMAMSIRDRLLENGYQMKSSVFWSMLNITGFWAEARSSNEAIGDPVVTRYLTIRTIWWIVAIGSFIGIVATGG
jgi:hypothetical protein